jgi:DUF971 family protein
MIEQMMTDAGGTRLTVTWEDGGQSHLSAETLRVNARDAWTKREVIDTGTVTVAPGLTITGIHPVGGYGVNLWFSDGHDKAIFPFVYLRELSDTHDN